MNGTLTWSDKLGYVSVPPREDRAIVRIAGEYAQECIVESGADAGWFLLFTEENVETSENAEFIYDSNSIQLFRFNGEEVSYGTYDIEFLS